MSAESCVRQKAWLARHLGWVLAVAFLLVGCALIAKALCRANEPDADGLLLNLGTEMVGIALTVGLVDFLVAWRSRQEHAVAIRPAVEDLVVRINQLARSHHLLLDEERVPIRESLDRYDSALKQASSSSLHLGTLVGNHQARLAALLSSFNARAEALLEEQEDVFAAVLSTSINLPTLLARFKCNSAQLQTLAADLVDGLRETYDLASSRSQVP